MLSKTGRPWRILSRVETWYDLGFHRSPWAVAAAVWKMDRGEDKGQTRREQKLLCWFALRNGTGSWLCPSISRQLICSIYNSWESASYVPGTGQVLGTQLWTWHSESVCLWSLHYNGETYNKWILKTQRIVYSHQFIQPILMELQAPSYVLCPTTVMKQPVPRPPPPHRPRPPGCAFWVGETVTK